MLEVCLRNNFAGVESFRLYAESFLGTKELVERYVDEGASPVSKVAFSHSGSWTDPIMVVLTHSREVDQVRKVDRPPLGRGKVALLPRRCEELWHLGPLPFWRCQLRLLCVEF